ncbi:MAG: hypothetical protein COC15_04355 [Legionellales bacterium]|nr:MAG: hypothetical protein COC15_04355 [Legionellales bacterium]
MLKKICNKSKEVISGDVKSKDEAFNLLYSRFIICGGYCAGKTSLRNLMENKLGIPKLIDDSTRKMRKGETEGSPYHFISRDKFKKNITSGIYHEWVQFNGNYYGVPKKEVFRLKPWSLDTLTKSYLSEYKNKVPKIFGIFLESPSDKIIIARAKSRGDDNEKIKSRLLKAKAEKSDSRFNLILPADLDLEKKLAIVIKHIIKPIKKQSMSNK